MAESEEELKNLLIKVKEETQKAGLKLNIQKPKVMASGPITSWQIHGEKMEKVEDFTFLGSKITVDGDMRLKNEIKSHEIKRCLLLVRKAMTNLDSVLKSRDITNKGMSSQSYGFSSSHVGMWELDTTEQLTLLNYGVGEDSWESLGLQGDQTSQS